MINPDEERSRFRFKMKLNLRWSDMDEMHHVNNAVYLTYLEEARIHYFMEIYGGDRSAPGVILASIRVDFLKPLVFPDTALLYARVSKFGNKSFEIKYLITGTNGESEKLVATADSTMVMYDYELNRTVMLEEEMKNRIRRYEITPV